jgi:magnesium chelatase subunit D
VTGAAPTLPRRRGRPQHSAGRTPQASRGRRTGSTPRLAGEPLQPVDLAATLAATLAAAVNRHSGDVTHLLPLRPTPADWHRQRFEQRPRRLVLFAVDISDSMGDGPEVRMSTALGAAAALARRAYLNRDQVALVTFRDRAATLTVPPTGSVQRLRDRLHRLAVGGATPLADGLRLARDTLRQARLKDPALQAVLVLISDGEATVPLRRGGDPLADALASANDLRRDGVASVLLDTGSAVTPQRQLPLIAAALGGQCRRLQELRAGDILQLLDTAAPARHEP